MKIHDSLRQECMPEMVFVLCKLSANGSYTKEKLKKLITLDTDKTDNYNKVFRFAVECGFLTETPEGIIHCEFSTSQVSSFKNFRYAVFHEINKPDGTVFNTLAQWYLSQGLDILQLSADRDLTTWAIRADISANIDENIIHGFRFWMAAFGLVTSEKYPLVFSTNVVMEEWLKQATPFAKNTPILARQFFDTLIREIPLFAGCISDNNLNVALSMGLRVLHLNKLIELKYTTDSGDTWHLTESISNPSTNHITEIIVRC